MGAREQPDEILRYGAEHASLRAAIRCAAAAVRVEAAIPAHAAARSAHPTVRIQDLPRGKEAAKNDPP